MPIVGIANTIQPNHNASGAWDTAKLAHAPSDSATAPPLAFSHIAAYT